MKQIYRDYLFTKHILVSDYGEEENESKCSASPETECFGALVTLAKRFGIRITEGAEMANMQMVKDAAMNLGEYVPEPFYRGFPQTVRELTNEQRLFDQLYHYTQTYGMGWFGEVGHSTMEEVFRRLAFDEKTEPKDFRILTAMAAEELLKGSIQDLLSGTRPLNIDQMLLVKNAWTDYKQDILPGWIGCKHTAIELLCETRDVHYFSVYLALPDVIKVLQCIQYNVYHSENLKKLNLKNQDRKLITKLLDEFFRKYNVEAEDPNWTSIFFEREYRECFEKRKIWCGLLHHIHYRPKCQIAEIFVRDIRNGDNCSAYSVFEDCMANGATIDAAEFLKKAKGNGTLLRNLDYILSRCKTEEEVKGVLSCLTD